MINIALERLVEGCFELPGFWNGPPGPQAGSPPAGPSFSPTTRAWPAPAVRLLTPSAPWATRPPSSSVRPAWRRVDALAENIRRAQLVVYPDAGHGSQFWYPGLFVCQAARFLDAETPFS